MMLAALSACSSAPGAPAHDAGTDVESLKVVLPDSGATCRSGTASFQEDAGEADPLCSQSSPSVSFAADVLPILAQCTGEICHAPWSYATLVSQHSTACCDHRFLVEPRWPSASHVVQAVRGLGACVSQMPLDEGSLPDDQIATLMAWVCQGALDN
jgi:hypothetical protein